MKITPKSEQELKQLKLLDPGIYNFTVISAKDKISQSSGEEMIELILSVYSLTGKEFLIYDYLNDNDTFSYKIRHICHCAGKIDKYESGEINASDLVGTKGKVKIIISKDKKGIYDDKNSVKDYLFDDKCQLELNDALPF